MLEIYAGNAARRSIQENGFTPELFNTFLGASGGPKWFTLFGLDKYIFGEFFKDRKAPLNLIGSSAGAFRAACFSQNDPVAAIERLASKYANTVYSDKPTPSEITTTGRELLDFVFGETGIDEIINNPVFKAHFLVAKSNGLVSSEKKPVQLLGLLNSFARNYIGREYLSKQYERYIFQQKDSDLFISDPDNFLTHTRALDRSNIRDSLMASGSIPLVMEGIADIAGCPKGMYRDGGIIDYHFDFDVKNEGLILYPHFSASLKAGWFDKNLNRKVRRDHYNKTVVICPSAAFIESLPYQKIPDRTDFTEMSSEQRIQYWHQVLKISDGLAHEFDTFLKHQNIDKIKNISLLTQ